MHPMLDESEVDESLRYGNVAAMAQVSADHAEMGVGHSFVKAQIDTDAQFDPTRIIGEEYEQYARPSRASSS